jgi:NAD(P)-dependent dehydrogenase (short-subunit alcohol dehydrogenase family)
MIQAKGKTIVVTGCTRGLGLAMTRFFASAGAVVCGCGRDEQAIEALRREFAMPHSFTRVDVSRDEQVQQWKVDLMASHGAPDLLLNNAAIINRNAPLWELEAQEVEDLMRVNVLGVVHMVRHFLPAMMERGKGVVVNFSSGWGRCTSADVATYCASKWGIEGLTQALAQDLSQAGASVSAVALNPGIIDTEMLRGCFGNSAGHYPRAEDWIQRAGPFLLSLGTKHHGRSLDVPGVPVA